MLEKLRILFITHFFPPTYNAGTENYTFGLAKALQDRGHKVEVLCAEDWSVGENYWNGVTEDIYEGVLVHRVHLNWMKAQNPNRVLYDSPDVEKWLDHFLDHHEFNLVHVTSTVTLGIGVLRSVSRHHIPLVLTLMDFWFICPSVQLYRSDGRLCDGNTTNWDCQSCLMEGSHHFRRYSNLRLPQAINSWVGGILSQNAVISGLPGFRGMLLNMAERKQCLPQALSLPDVVITHSSTVKEIISQNTNLAVELLRNGQDLTWLSGYRGKSKLNSVRFGYIGQLQHTKGVHILIEAFQSSNLEGSATLSIWGDLTANVEYVHRLENLIENNSSIRMLGRYERHNLERVLQEIDIIVAPSIWYENAPLVIQEAFATQTPVIATRLGGMAEAVSHEVNGLLFERGDVVDLSKQLQRIVNEPGLLDSLRSNVPRVKTMAEEVEELEQIYEELVLKYRRASFKGGNNTE